MRVDESGRLGRNDRKELNLSFKERGESQILRANLDGYCKVRILGALLGTRGYIRRVTPLVLAYEVGGGRVVPGASRFRIDSF